MIDNTNFFEPNFQDQNTEEDSMEEMDMAVCSECKGTFLLPSDTEVDQCPLCNVKFDGSGG